MKQTNGPHRKLQLLSSAQPTSNTQGTLESGDNTPTAKQRGNLALA